MTSRNDRGFSLLEMLVVVSIGFVIAGMTFMAVMPALNKGHVDDAYDTALMVLRNTRNLAIAQSHEYYVCFNPSSPCDGGYPAGTIEVEYQPPASTVGGTLPPLQLVNTYKLPSDVTFNVMSGFPTHAPDGFGNGVKAIDFGQGLGGGSLSYVVFMPDGSSQDSNGNYNSGIVYFYRTNDTLYSARSITVWGATGRIRGWRLYPGTSSSEWVQQ